LELAFYKKMTIDDGLLLRPQLDRKMFVEKFRL